MLCSVKSSGLGKMRPTLEWFLVLQFDGFLWASARPWPHIHTRLIFDYSYTSETSIHYHTLWYLGVQQSSPVSITSQGDQLQT
ncbi:hypothetical protein F5888DRAFT_1758846, partial [Russula emetica]